MASVEKRGSPPPTPPLEDIRRATPPIEAEKPERPARAPSPDNCPICLDVFTENTDRSYSDSCYHIFCFECLLEWSNNKRECPLCKKPFKSIIHKIKDHNTYKIHTLKEPEPQRLFLPGTPPFNNVTWEWMTQMRAQYMLNRQRQLDRMRDATDRYLSLGVGARNVLRPSTTDRRRYIYRYGLYCEGAQPIGGAARYRRTTPEFYRRNPAIIHRLVPWLNRELVAILPHRDNVQFVLDHILAEIRRVDMRSAEFRESILPFTLRHTNHFIHEFRMFAMSPFDMAGFDTYAKYPSARGRRALPDEPPAATDPTAGPSTAPTRPPRVNITDPPGSSSSMSDSDVDIVSRVDVRIPHRRSRSSRGGVYSQVSPPTIVIAGHRAHSRRGRRTRWHVERLREENNETMMSHPSELRRIRDRYRNDAARLAVGAAASIDYDHGLTPTQRASRNRLERSLRYTADNSMSSNYYEPPETVQSAAPQTTSTDSDVLNRVRSFLNTLHSESSASAAQPSMPLFGELTGELPSTSSQSVQPSSSRDGRSGGPSALATLRLTPDSDTTSASRTSTPTVYVSSSLSRARSRSRSVSPSSSHSSDVIVVAELKPYRERTPIELSSDSEDEKIDVTSKPLSGTARLSDSSSDDGKADDSTAPMAVPSARWRGRPPSLTSSSDEELNHSPAPSARLAVEPSDDSDCVVTFEATKPSRRRVETPEASRDSEEEPKRKKKKKKDSKRKEEKSHKVKKHKQHKGSKKHSKHHKHVLAGRTISPSEPKESLQDAETTDCRNNEQSSSSKTHHSHPISPKSGNVSDCPASPHIDVVEPESKPGADNSQFYLDYTQGEYSHSPDNQESTKKPTNIRKQIRYFVKKNIAEKYQGKTSCKKHHKGHKNSTSQ